MSPRARRLPHVSREAVAAQRRTDILAELRQTLQRRGAIGLANVYVTRAERLVEELAAELAR